MYDFFSQRSNYPFKGFVFNDYRYLQQDITIDASEYNAVDVTQQTAGTFYILVDGEYIKKTLPQDYQAGVQYYSRDAHAWELKKGQENPYFKLSPTEFVFNITSMNVVDKKQPIGNLILSSEQMSIVTKTNNPWFKQGGYIEYDKRLWVIKTAEKEKGPQKSIYGFFNYNPLSTIKMLVEEVQE